jgi:hypothetical protein
MTELEQQLRALAAEVDWPTTPPPGLRLEPRPHARSLRPVWIALAVLALALAIALSVPSARSAFLRVLHLGGATVERVDVLPPAQERPLAAGLGPVAGPAEVRAALGAPMRLPKGARSAEVHLRSGIASVVLATPQPVLLSEFANGFLLKKLAATTTNVEWLQVGSAPALWITGGQHVVVLPAAPPRLAGNVLVWERGKVTYRLEGRGLGRRAALRLASQITGT